MGFTPSGRVQAPDRSARWSRAFGCDRLFFSFAVWWSLWVRCETELGARDFLLRVDSFRTEFVVPVFFL